MARVPVVRAVRVSCSLYWVTTSEGKGRCFRRDGLVENEAVRTVQTMDVMVRSRAARSAKEGGRGDDKVVENPVPRKRMLRGRIARRGRTLTAQYAWPVVGRPGSMEVRSAYPSALVSGLRVELDLEELEEVILVGQVVHGDREPHPIVRGYRALVSAVRDWKGIRRVSRCGRSQVPLVSTKKAPGWTLRWSAPRVLVGPESELDHGVDPHVVDAWMFRALDTALFSVSSLTTSRGIGQGREVGSGGVRVDVGHVRQRA